MNYGVIGCSGRMGREIQATFGESGHRAVLLADENGCHVEAPPQVIVDFSLPGALPQTLRMCREYRAALVLGTTGFSPSDIAEVRALGRECAVVHSSNFGVGINLMAMILSDYAGLLSDWEIEIEETHHNKKRDAPSGTALMLMEATGRTAPTHSLRLGNIPGDHTVHFANGDEILSMSHRIVNRSLLSRGALRAAVFAENAAPGYYNFQDVLRSERSRPSAAEGM